MRHVNQTHALETEIPKHRTKFIFKLVQNSSVFPNSRTDLRTEENKVRAENYLLKTFAKKKAWGLLASNSTSAVHCYARESLGFPRLGLLIGIITWALSQQKPIIHPWWELTECCGRWIKCSFKLPYASFVCVSDVDYHLPRASKKALGIRKIVDINIVKVDYQTKGIRDYSCQAILPDSQVCFSSPFSGGSTPPPIRFTRSALRLGFQQMVPLDKLKDEEEVNIITWDQLFTHGLCSSCNSKHEKLMKMHSRTMLTTMNCHFVIEIKWVLQCDITNPTWSK